MILDTSQLRYFRAVAETLNFTRAASNLYMSQTTLSYQISSLEKEIGTKLFNRGHAGVTLTPAGEKLLEYAPKILCLLDEAVDAVANVGRGVNDVLRIGFLGSHEQRFLPRLISEFNERYPDVDTVLRQGSPRRLMDMLEERTLDFIFTISKENPMSVEGVTVDLFDKLPMFAIMRKDNEFANRQQLERCELAGQKLCFLNEDEGPALNKHFVESFAKCGVERPFIDTTATMESVIMLIESKGYTTIAPRCLMENHRDAIVAVPMSGEDEFVYQGGAWRADDKNPIIPLFIELAKEQLAARQGKDVDSAA